MSTQENGAGPAWNQPHLDQSKLRLESEIDQFTAHIIGSGSVQPEFRLAARKADRNADLSSLSRHGNGFGDAHGGSLKAF